MEADVEQKLREKYTLIDKTDPAAIAAAQQVITCDKINRPNASHAEGFLFAVSSRNILQFCKYKYQVVFFFYFLTI